MENTRVPEEIQKELQSVVKSIRQLSDSFGTIASALERMTLADSPPAKSKRAPVRKKVTVKNGVVEKIKRVPSTQIVYDIIQKSAQGMDTTALMKATGFNQRKIHNITFRLKNNAKIKSVKRGVYQKM